MDKDTLGRDVADLIEAEDLTGAILIGHSMGCRVAMEARDLARGRVAALVLVDGSRLGAASVGYGAGALIQAAISAITRSSMPLKAS